MRERDLEEHNRRLALLESENERPYAYGRHRHPHPHATRHHHHEHEHEQQESHEHGHVHEHDGNGNGAQREHDHELNILHVEPSELDRELPPYEAVDSGVPISLRGQVEQALGIQVSMDADGTYTYTTTVSTQSPLVTQSQLVDLGYQFYTRDSPAGLVMSSTSSAPRLPVTQREAPVAGSESVNVNVNAEGGPSGAGANGNGSSSASTRANRRRARAVSIDSASEFPTCYSLGFASVRLLRFLGSSTERFVILVELGGGSLPGLDNCIRCMTAHIAFHQPVIATSQPSFWPLSRISPNHCSSFHFHR